MGGMKLLAHQPWRIGPPTTRGAADAVPPARADGTPEALRADLAMIVGRRNVHGRISDLVRYASDASPYRLVPQVVVSPQTAPQVAELLRWCAANGHHATFRAGGTALSGQAQGDDVLIDVRRHWAGFAVEDGGARVRVRPGAVLADVNTVLARVGRQLGPDPASGRAATLGGVLANNAAGMRCTPARSAYATLRDCTFVLPSGTIIDTAAPDAERRFGQAEPDLAGGLLQMRREILADPDLHDLVRTKYAIRNTTGYTMRAFLDADTPLGIFRRLLVGSEGTLAFVAEAVLETVPLPAASGLWWIHLPSLADAVGLVHRIKDLAITDLGPTAVEMLPGRILVNAAARFEQAPPEWADLPTDAACLLVEFGADTHDGLLEADQALQELVAGHPLLHPAVLDTDEDFALLSWRVRSELSSDLARSRPPGAAAVNEDVCFPLPRLAEAVVELQDLLDRYGYPNIVAGHAAYGNMHFILTPLLGDAAERARYGRFMDDFAALVIDKYRGSLKAEHGTGLNMAPYVEREWGPAVTALMWRVKELADPDGVLAPDCLLTRDDGVHLRRFKSEPAADAVIDTCIECGFCEPVCPSRNVTTTPRQRIALRREMARQAPGSPLLAALVREYQYDAIDTCAVDSSCAVACPYDIDTGALMKDFRARQSGPVTERVWTALAGQWRVAESGARLVLGAADVLQRRLGWQTLRAVADGVRAVVDPDLVPTVPGPMPPPADSRLPSTTRDGAHAVYFPACVNRIFGRDPDGASSGQGLELTLPEALVTVCDRAGRPVWIPDVAGHCCGTVWSSKGHREGRDAMYARTARSVLDWTEEGRLPLVVDASSCTWALLREVPAHLPDDLAARYRRVEVVDATAWCGRLLGDLTVRHRLGSVAVHPGCSATRLGLTRTLLRLAREIADEVTVPAASSCCGTAGDRGLLHPELVRSAVRDEAVDLARIGADRHLATNRTCELGLRQATGRTFESVVFAVEEATRP